MNKRLAPKTLMKLAFQRQATEFSPENTVFVLEKFGFEQARSTMHNWVQKADLETQGGKAPDLVAINETVVWLNDERFWLYATIDPVLRIPPRASVTPPVRRWMWDTHTQYTIVV